MVMNLVRKSKVEKSPHFEEIVLRLSEGQSARSISRWLENEFNEKISHAAIARYYNDKISMESKVEAELNRRAERRKPKEDPPEVKQKVQAQADKIEAINNIPNIVAGTIAENMEGVAKVASQFPEKFEQACRDAEDEDSNVTSKDVARLALDANKLYNDYFKKNESNVEVNVENNMNDLGQLFDTNRIRERLNAKRKFRKSKSKSDH